MTNNHKLPPKTPSECRVEIERLIRAAESSGITITAEERETAMTSDDWNTVQPILDKAQGVEK